VPLSVATGERERALEAQRRGEAERTGRLRSAVEVRRNRQEDKYHSLRGRRILCFEVGVENCTRISIRAKTAQCELRPGQEKEANEEEPGGSILLNGSVVSWGGEGQEGPVGAPESRRKEQSFIAGRPPGGAMAKKKDDNKALKVERRRFFYLRRKTTKQGERRRKVNPPLKLCPKDNSDPPMGVPFSLQKRREKVGLTQTEARAKKSGTCLKHNTNPVKPKILV